MKRAEEIKATVEASKKRATSFNQAIRMYEDGTVFEYNGREYIIISRNMIGICDTNVVYFRGLDF